MPQQNKETNEWEKCRHINIKHNQDYAICTRCGETFTSSKETIDLKTEIRTRLEHAGLSTEYLGFERIVETVYDLLSHHNTELREKLESLSQFRYTDKKLKDAILWMHVKKVILSLLPTNHEKR